MTEDQFERLVVSFESIAKSLGEIGVIGQRIYDHKYPERGAPREAVLTRIKSEEDLIKERQGATGESVAEWLTGYEDAEFIGDRERAFLEEKRKKNESTEGRDTGQDAAGPEATRSKARSTRKRSPAESND